MQSPLEILRQYWGYSSFRGEQLAIIESVLAGRDTLALLPTGGGKSVCFQVSALLLPGVCVVVTPLIALMKDQVEHLTARGITARALYSGLAHAEIKTILSEAVQGKIKFLYVSPERLQTRLFESYFSEMQVSLIAVDEAHCISQWGYDFRPPYLQIATLRTVHRAVPVLAVTASATPPVVQDILQYLALRQPAVFRQSFARPNLSYSVVKAESKLHKLTDILQKVPGTGIVYCSTRRQAREVAALLQQQNIPAGFYHAGLSVEERAAVQGSWMRNETRIVVCTNAFGMGIDKPDVRLVVHYNVTDCLENYYQEAGRAGRNGQRAYAVLLYDGSDEQQLQQLPGQRYPALAAVRQVYQHLADFLQVPKGSGQGLYYDFDLLQFVQTFKLEPRLVTNALKVLEQEGFISYNEQVFLPARIHFTAGKTVLDDLDQTYPQLAETARTLLRSYGGILEQPIPVSEWMVAKARRLPKDLVVQQLQQLHIAGIIAYLPRKDTPQLYFVTNRAAAGELHINEQRYFERKKAYTEKVQQVLRYLDLTGCREAFIGRYFGDETLVACGSCDNCIRNKRQPLTVAAFRAIAEELLELLAAGEHTLAQVLQHFQTTSKVHVKEVLFYLQAERTLRIVEDRISRL